MSPDDPPKYGHPVARGEDQHEPTADEDDASQLHVTELHSILHDVVSLQSYLGQVLDLSSLPTCRCRHSCYQAKGDEVLISDDDAEVGKKVGS